MTATVRQLIPSPRRETLVGDLVAVDASGSHLTMPAGQFAHMLTLCGSWVGLDAHLEQRARTLVTCQRCEAAVAGAAVTVTSARRASNDDVRSAAGLRLRAASILAAAAALDPAGASLGHSYTTQGGGDDGSDRAGDGAATPGTQGTATAAGDRARSDGATGHDGGRTEPEPPPAVETATGAPVAVTPPVLARRGEVTGPWADPSRSVASPGWSERPRREPGRTGQGRLLPGSSSPGRSGARLASPPRPSGPTATPAAVGPEVTATT